MPEDQIQRLKDAITEMMRIFEASGSDLNSEMGAMMMQAMEHVGSRIQQIRREAETPQEPQGAAPSPAAQLLWILAGQQEQPFLSYLREFPSEDTQALLNNPTELSRVIGFLNRMMPQGEQPVVNGIQHADLNSSNIWGSRYDPKTGKMRVRFQGGSEYEYDGVPANIYRAFQKGNASAKTDGRNQYGVWFRGKNPSMGAALNQYIKAGNFPYRKIR